MGSSGCGRRGEAAALGSRWAPSAPSHPVRRRRRSRGLRSHGYPSIVAGIDLTVRVGAVMIFGPRNGALHPGSAGTGIGRVVVSLQQRIALACEADPKGQFGAWALEPPCHAGASQSLSDDVSKAVSVLGSHGEVDARIQRCRRWDGNRRTAWWLT